MLACIAQREKREIDHKLVTTVVHLSRGDERAKSDASIWGQNPGVLCAMSEETAVSTCNSSQSLFGDLEGARTQ